MVALAAPGMAETVVLSPDEPPDQKPGPPPLKPKVEVTFVLDTTGSMGGLIAGAKKKIWSIANQIVRGIPEPDLRIGLVGYRDKGDAYVTKVYPLTDDLDQVFKNLMQFKAQGGGDTPEHVNKALRDAVHEIHWAKSNDVLKIIYLVGDCPPHMDYQDGFDYKKHCQEAVKNGIVINTVQCGNQAATVKFWTDIARRAEGSYARIQQSGGMRFVATPHDKALAALNAELTRTTVTYGGRRQRARAMSKAAAAVAMPVPEAAGRAEYAARKGVGAGATDAGFDLVNDVKEGRADLGKLKDEELPEKMKKMSPDERKAYLEKVAKEREVVRKKITELSEKRNQFIKKELARRAKAGEADSFDAEVLKSLRAHAAKKGIKY